MGGAASKTSDDPFASRARARARLGVVGCGQQGAGVLLPAASAVGFNVVAVHDRDPERLSAVANRWPTLTTYNDIDEFFLACDFDAVIVALPGHDHYPVARRALEIGCDVFVEKPPGVALDEVVALAQLAAERSRTCVVGMNFRYSQGVTRLREMLVGAQFGEPLHVRVLQAAKKPYEPLWNTSDLLHGLFFAQGIHAIDLAMGLSGDIAVETAHCLPMRDGAALRLTYTGPDNTTGEVLMTSAAAALFHRAEVLTTTGALITLKDLDEISVQPGLSDTLASTYPGRRVVWRRPPLGSGFDSAGYSGVLADFRDVINGASPSEQLPTCRQSEKVFEVFNQAMAIVGRHGL